MIQRSRHCRPRARLLILPLALCLGGCDLVAWPVRTASDIVKTVPVAGPIAAAPLDATADVID